MKYALTSHHYKSLQFAYIPYFSFILLVQQTAIVSRYTSLFLIFVNKMQCVYCDVGPESLLIFMISFMIESVWDLW